VRRFDFDAAIRSPEHWDHFWRTRTGGVILPLSRLSFRGTGLGSAAWNDEGEMVPNYRSKLHSSSFLGRSTAREPGMTAPIQDQQNLL
jgi:hypothetical protein